MKCKYCEAETADDSLFCEHCGKKIGEESSSASTNKPKLGKKTVRTICIAAAGLIVGFILASLLLPSDNDEYVYDDYDDPTQEAYATEDTLAYEEWETQAPAEEVAMEAAENAEQAW